MLLKQEDFPQKLNIWFDSNLHLPSVSLRNSFKQMIK